MAKKLIECPKCRGTGDQGSWRPQMTQYGYDDGTELCERCRGKGKIQIAARAVKHVEHSEPLPICDGPTYSIYLNE